MLCRPRPGIHQVLTESEQLLIAEENFYNVLRPHVPDGREYAGQAARTGDSAVNRDWA